MLLPARLVALFGAAAILTIAVPFGTGDVMRALPRFAYWAVIVIGSYGIGYWGNTCAEQISKPPRAFLKRLLAATLITVFGVVLLVHLLNGLSIGYWASGWDLVTLTGNIAIISAIITLIFQLTDLQHAKHPPQTHITLLDRLPLEKRAPLVSISVEDHYVRIRTTLAEDMILMRLADAIRETADTGLQVHRSHWVATDQVTNATRKGDGAILTMTTGPDIPVSRANVPKIKEAGLLPR